MVLGVLGSLLLSAALAYAWWTRVRVSLLRQDLFAIRDRLFDEAARMCAMSDDGYREARHRLNLAIRSADLLSLWVIGYVLTKDKPLHDRVYTKTPRLQEHIDRALSNMTWVQYKYLIHRTATGLALMGTLRLFQLQAGAGHQLKTWVGRWTLTDGPEGAARISPI